MFDKQDSQQLWAGAKLEKQVNPASNVPISQRDPYSNTGVKHDAGKPRYDLIPPEALTALASVLTFGAQKYSARNWELGMPYGRVFAATMRHLWAWWSGDSKDAETGYSHLWHALCCVAFLLTFEARKIGQDDRPRSGEKL